MPLLTAKLYVLLKVYIWCLKYSCRLLDLPGQYDGDIQVKEQYKDESQSMNIADGLQAVGLATSPQTTIYHSWSFFPISDRSSLPRPFISLYSELGMLPGKAAEKHLYINTSTGLPGPLNTREQY